MIKNLEDASTRVSQVVIDIGTFSRSLAQGDGTIRKLVMDPGLYNSLNEAAASASKSVIRLDRILYDFAIFADKLARHPELLGVSGAIGAEFGNQAITPMSFHFRTVQLGTPRSPAWRRPALPGHRHFCHGGERQTMPNSITSMSGCLNSPPVRR